MSLNESKSPILKPGDLVRTKHNTLLFEKFGIQTPTLIRVGINEYLVVVSKPIKKYTTWEAKLYVIWVYWPRSQKLGFFSSISETEVMEIVNSYVELVKL